MKDIKALGKELGRNQELAAALFDTGVYEARILASFTGDPDRITASGMDRWCQQFDNWACCDTMCFHLFDRTPHVWEMTEKWSRSPKEFVKRTAFALLWSASLHDKHAPDPRFLRGLELIEREAGDGRNFVMKAISMALKAIGKRNPELRRSATALARRLRDSADPSAHRVGKDALRDLSK